MFRRIQKMRPLTADASDTQGSATPAHGSALRAARRQAPAGIHGGNGSRPFAGKTNDEHCGESSEFI